MTEDLLDKLTRGARIMLAGAHAETGQTPKEVIWSRNKARLYHYRSEHERTHRVPVLFVYALLNRPYCLDLTPGNSFVEFLVNEGFDVYLLDWGIAGPEDRDQSFDDLVLDFLPRAVKKVLALRGYEEFTLFGYCMGGAISLMYAALVPEGLKNLVLLATPVDCSPQHTELYGRWFAEPNHDPDVILNAYGNLPRVRLHRHRPAQPRHELHRQIREHVGNGAAGQAHDRVAGDEQMGRRSHPHAGSRLQTMGAGLLPAQPARPR